MNLSARCTVGLSDSIYGLLPLNCVVNSVEIIIILSTTQFASEEHKFVRATYSV